MIPIPAHLAHIMTSLAAPMDTTGLDTEHQVLWAAIEKVKQNLHNEGLILYQLALVSLKDIAQNVRVRILFEDNRLNHMLDHSVMTTEGRVMMKTPEDFGYNWRRHTGLQDVRYAMTILGRASRVIYKGKTLDVALASQYAHIGVPDREAIDQSGVGHRNLILNQFTTTGLTNRLGIEAYNDVIGAFRRDLVTAFEEGKTHSVRAD